METNIAAKLYIDNLIEDIEEYIKFIREVEDKNIIKL